MLEKQRRLENVSVNPTHSSDRDRRLIINSPEVYLFLNLVLSPLLSHINALVNENITEETLIFISYSCSLSN